MLTHRVPYPPDRGDRIRSWNILSHLSRRYDVSLGCVSEEKVERETKTKLDSVCDQVCIAPMGLSTKWIRAGLSAARGRSLTEGMFWSPTLCAMLDHWQATKSFDGVLVYCSSMLRYARRKSLRQIPHFVDLVDVDSQKFYEYSDNARAWKKALYRTEARRVRRIEHDAVRMAKAVTLVSDQEAALLADTLDPGEYPIHGIANGVDKDYFSPNFDRSNKDALTEVSHTNGRGHWHDDSESLRLVFVGVLNYPPNTEALAWFVTSVWPQLKSRLPHVTLNIVGKHPPPQILRLSRIEGINVTGAVPDVRPHLKHANLVIAPLRIARGVQNKVLEAMAMQRPVIASPAAATGIDAANGKHLCIADTPKEWINQIASLHQSKCKQTKIAQNARQLICDQYSWNATLTAFDRLLDLHLE